MPTGRRLVGLGCGLAILGTLVAGACTLAVCASIAPRTDVVDARVRAPEAPDARVVSLPGWRGVRIDTLSETRTRHRMGVVGPIAIRETGDALVLRASRIVRDDPDQPLPIVRVELTNAAVTVVDTTAWAAAGPATTFCSKWSGGERVDGDPWDAEAPRAPFPYVTLDTLGSAGAHVIATGLSADSRALAVLSGAGPRTETWVPMGGWEAVEGPRYLEVFADSGEPIAGPVRLPPEDEPAAMDWPHLCWSPSGRAVVLALPQGSLDADALKIAVLDLGR